MIKIRKIHDKRFFKFCTKAQHGGRELAVLWVETDHFPLAPLTGTVMMAGVWAFCVLAQESPRQTKPKKGPKRKVHELRPFLWIQVFSLGKQARFTLNFCSGMPLGKVHELTFFGLVCRGHSWLAACVPREFEIPNSLVVHFLHDCQASLIETHTPPNICTKNERHSGREQEKPVQLPLPGKLYTYDATQLNTWKTEGDKRHGRQRAARIETRMTEVEEQKD